MSNKEMGADIVLGWPSAEIALMGAEGAVSVLYRKEIEAAEDKEQILREKIQEYREKFNTPIYAASKMQIDMIIQPRETRRYINQALDILENKKAARAGRKHGNIPL